ncbi:MAG TPA: FtsQ-type POTRA domain-containing protein [Thermoanaerobaculia bacterium]
MRRTESESLFLRRDRIPRRRRRWARWVRLGFVAALVLLSAAGTFRFLRGSLFSLQRFEVIGNQRARTEEILQALARWRGSNLVTLNLAPAAAALQQLPWVERVTLAKRFPDGLTVRVTERIVAALFKEGGQLWWLDGRGQTIAPYDPRAEKGDFVIIRGDRARLADAVGLLDDLRKRRPEYVAALSEIDALPEGDFGMMDSIFRRPVRVFRRDAPEKIDTLLAARGLIQSRGWEARTIDLRFADRIVLEGAYGVGHSL